MSQQRTRRGRISYRSLSPGEAGREHGREQFHMTFLADGRRTLSATCKNDETPTVLRHVVMTYEANGRPSEACVRMDVGGDYSGSV